MPAKKAPKAPAAKSSSKSASAAKPASKSVKSSKESKPAAKAKKPEPKAIVKKKPVTATDAGKAPSVRRTRGKEAPAKAAPAPAPAKPVVKAAPVAEEKYPPGFAQKQKQRLLELKDALVDTMEGVANDTIRARAEGSEASAFGMHQADAGSDASDRDFALTLLSQEQDALYEIEEALKRIDAKTYGVCEMCGKMIPIARLDVRPYARYTVDCQEIFEKEGRSHQQRRNLGSLFGLGKDDDDDDEEETVENERE